MAGSRADGWALLGLGTALAAGLIVPMVLGWLLDRGVGTTPLFTLVGLLLGIATAARTTYIEVRKIFGSGHE